MKIVSRVLSFSVLLYVLAPLGAMALHHDAYAQSAAPSTPAIIFDSDYGPDVDDLVAHAVLHALADRGEAEIIAGIVSISNAKSPGAMNAVDTWHGRSGIPVGGFKGTVDGGRFDGGPLFPRGGQGESDGDAWAVSIYDAQESYPRRVTENNYEDALSVYRDVLRAADDKSVRIVTAGMLNTLSELLDSPGDQIDGRSGRDLIAAKVEAVYVMGARSSGAEFNMRHAPAAAANVAAGLPVPIYWNQFEIGASVYTGKWNGSGSPAPGHIVRFGMEAFNHIPGSDGNGRQSWDAMTVLAAVRGASAGFAFESGKMTINASTGASSWVANPQGPHRRVSKTQSDAHYEALLEPLVFSSQSDAAPEPDSPARPRPPGDVRVTKAGDWCMSGDEGALAARYENAC